MKLKLLSLIAVVLITGCASTPESQIKQLAADARDVAEIGTAIVLLENPSLRKELQFTLDRLITLESLPDPITIDKLTDMLHRLPFTELQSNKTQLYILGGQLILRRATHEVELGSMTTLRPIVSALRQGMQSALTK